MNAKDAKDNDFDNFDDFENTDRLNPNDAITHFSNILNQTKADLTMKALQLMTKFISELCANINSNYESIYNCIRALRHACVNEDEPDVFNTY